jgi:hypothetical protein
VSDHDKTDRHRALVASLSAAFCEKLCGFVLKSYGRWRQTHSFRNPCPKVVPTRLEAFSEGQPSKLSGGRCAVLGNSWSRSHARRAHSYFIGLWREPQDAHGVPRWPWRMSLASHPGRECTGTAGQLVTAFQQMMAAIWICYLSGNTGNTSLLLSCMQHFTPSVLPIPRDNMLLDLIRAV